jgi:hypothetical protein
MWKESLRGIVLAGAVIASACSGSAAAPSADADLPVVLRVTPASNSASVLPSSSITIVFNHSMMVGMELLVILHEGTVLGPQVAGSFSWSSDPVPHSLSRRPKPSSPRQPTYCTWGYGMTFTFTTA